MFIYLQIHQGGAVAMMTPHRMVFFFIKTGGFSSVKQYLHKYISKINKTVVFVSVVFTTTSQILTTVHYQKNK
jgi:DNA-binding MurR/RpiR family transcriptional regulator